MNTYIDKNLKNRDDYELVKNLNFCVCGNFTCEFGSCKNTFYNIHILDIRGYFQMADIPFKFAGLYLYYFETTPVQLFFDRRAQLDIFRKYGGTVNNFHMLH